MTTARNTAMCILLAALGVGLVLSVLTHVIHEPFGGMSYVEYAADGSVVAVVAYVCLYGTARLARRWLPRSVRCAVCVAGLVILGLVALRQAPEQLSPVGFAARNRIPDPAATGLAVGCAGLALWQIVENFRADRFLSNSLVISVLIFLNIYLFFAAW
ncbi:MAG: hypothetical protein LAP21_10390 [Acidobacteriia bacterium]|nr:hypothetical protein [Terriglobia bacterium]